MSSNVIYHFKQEGPAYDSSLVGNSPKVINTVESSKSAVIKDVSNMKAITGSPSGTIDISSSSNFVGTTSKASKISKKFKRPSNSVYKLNGITSNFTLSSHPENLVDIEIINLSQYMTNVGGDYKIHILNMSPESLKLNWSTPDFNVIKLLERTSPGYNYTGGNKSRGFSIPFKFHRDMFVASSGDEAQAILNYLVRQFESLNYPVYVDGGVVAPYIEIRVGNIYHGKGYVTVDSVNWSGMIYKKQYTLAELTLNFVEVLDVGEGLQEILGNSGSSGGVSINQILDDEEEDEDDEDSYEFDDDPGVYWYDDGNGNFIPPQSTDPDYQEYMNVLSQWQSYYGRQYSYKNDYGADTNTWKKPAKK